MKPVIYGYIKVMRGTPDTEVIHMEQALRDYAQTEGYRLGEIFYEEDNGRVPALTELVEELKRSKARHVIMPTLDHLAYHSLIRIYRLNHLEQDANAQVLTLDDR